MKIRSSILRESICKYTIGRYYSRYASIYGDDKIWDIGCNIRNEGDIPNEFLSNINSLSIDISDFNYSEIQELMLELPNLLRYLQLEEFEFGFLGSTDAGENVPVLWDDMSFLKQLNKSVKRIKLRLIDFSSSSPTILSGFNNSTTIDCRDCIVPQAIMSNTDASVSTNLNKNLDIKINNVFQVSVEKLMQIKVQNILLSCRYKRPLSILSKGKPYSLAPDRYSIEEYTQIRREIDAIIDQVKLPENDDPDYDKKIFGQVYRMLGETISYDYSAMSEEGEKDKRLSTTCRNLIGAFCRKSCVCEGNALALKEVLEYFGIECHRVFNDIHVWNLVKLDGEYFWTDLTGDEDAIKAKRFPLPYCLKSSKDYYYTDSREFSGLDEELLQLCTRCLSDEEQTKLFTDERPENKVDVYLSSFVNAAARGIKISDFYEIGKRIESIFRENFGWKSRE